jgi:hypothetical protein
MDEERLVQVYASADTTDGLLMQGRLETEGIPVMLKGESEGPYRMGPTYLWVPAEHEAKAREIIEAVRSGAYALAEDADVSGDEPAEDATPR